MAFTHHMHILRGSLGQQVCAYLSMIYQSLFAPIVILLFFLNKLGKEPRIGSVGMICCETESEVNWIQCENTFKRRITHYSLSYWTSCGATITLIGTDVLEFETEMCRMKEKTHICR